VQQHGEAETDAAEEPQHQTLDEKLTRDSRASCAERSTNRHLAPPRRRSRQLQAGHVRRRRDEQQAHGGQQLTIGRRTSAVTASWSGVAAMTIGPVLPKIAIVVMPVSAAKRSAAAESGRIALRRWRRVRGRR
jgi:hypothetical protein